jgi:hypothetical protein
VCLLGGNPPDPLFANARRTGMNFVNFKTGSDSGQFGFKIWIPTFIRCRALQPCVQPAPPSNMRLVRVGDRSLRPTGERCVKQATE